MFRQIEETILAIQIISMALVFLSCLTASIGAALICTLSIWRTSSRDRVRGMVKGPTSQGGQSTGWLEGSGRDQG